MLQSRWGWAICKEKKKKMRCVEMNTRAQWAPCFLGNVFSVAKQLKTSLLAGAALFSDCDAIPLLCPAEGWAMAMHTAASTNTGAHVHVQAEGEMNRRTWTRACVPARADVHTSLKLSRRWQQENTPRYCSTRHPLCEAPSRRQTDLLRWIKISDRNFTVESVSNVLTQHRCIEHRPQC